MPFASSNFAANLRRAPAFRRLVGALATGLVAALSASAQPLPSESPFLPRTGESSATSAADSTYEFVGMTTIGDETLISITRTKDKVSTWIPLGKTVSEITAVSYDPKTDHAVIRASGQTLTLTMRKANVVVGPLASPLVATTTQVNPPPPTGPMSDSAIVAGLPTKPISAQEQKEFEARMMVSDLLEIGQQQRRAYEEAQRKAAAHAPKNLPVASPIPPAPATSTTSTH